MMFVRLIFVVMATVAFGRQINPKRELLLRQLDVIKELGKQLLDDPTSSPKPFTPLYPDLDYWKFLPQFYAALLPTGESVTWSSPCFGENVGTATYAADKKSVAINIVSSKPLTVTECHDTYMSGTTSAIVVKTKISSNKLSQVTTSYTLELPADITPAEYWDIDTKGVRMMRYFVTGEEAYASLLHTIQLFGGEMTQHVLPTTAARNIDFLGKYAKIDIQPRDPALNIVPDESEVKSGDAFYIMRLDGLNPMLAWAMGSTTGHVTSALWIDGELYVCESTTASAYWPKDYIQRTPYRTWIQQTIDADMQVIWAPLSDEARSNYNEAAAVAFFKANEGMNYGFEAMLWPWLDTPKSNFPCLPPDFSSNCLQWELLEFIIAKVDRLVPDIGDLMWNAGFAQRLQIPFDGTLRTSDYYYQGMQKLNKTSNDLLQMVELDTYMYATTQNGVPTQGRAMVCCVLVCSTWKAAGVFGALADDINCAEQTNYDDYALQIHSAAGYRQIVGTYSLTLPGFRTKEPYAHMAETCGALPPTYERAAGC